MISTSRCLLVLAALLAMAAPASAADPLLSGYAGPGGGDQALLGSEVLPGPSGAGNGGGGSGRPGTLRAPRPATPELGTAPIAAIAAAAPLSPAPAPVREAPVAAKPESAAPATKAREGGRPSAAPAARPTGFATVRYPATREDAAPGLPAGPLVALLLGAAALIGTAVVTGRLGTQQHPAIGA